VDIDPVSLNLDAAKIESAITARTKAILAVEVFGNPAGIDKICEIAAKHDLPVVEDGCEALGSALGGKKVGTFGTMSVFGFYPNKQITTGEGGMILSDDDSLAETCVSLRNQGRGKGGGWLAHERLGYKAKRREVARWYHEMLAGDERLMIPAEPPDCELSWFVFVVRLADDFSLEKRNEILEAMGRRSIQVGNYFPPVHLQPFIAEQFGHKCGDFPITERVSERTIALPFHNNLTKDHVAIVCKELRRLLN
jgi:perosamine synthetase